MSGLNFHRHLVAAFAAILVSSVAVSAAVGPGTVSHSNDKVSVITYA